MNRMTFFAAVGAAFLLGASGAVAEDGQMHVRLGDLNLQTADGAQAAIDRIRHSAAAFCEADVGRRPLGQAMESQKCVGRMSAKAVEALNAPQVTALYQGRAATVLAER
jgi:UrcA family protein